MDIYEVLNDWGINMPNAEHLPYECIAYLCNNNSENIYYIDKFPLPVEEENYEKLDQMDICYQQIVQGEVSKDDFLQIETKYRNTMNKLWLYNKTFTEFVLPDLYFEKPSVVIDKEYKNFLSLLDDNNKKSQLFEVKQKEELEFWVQIGVRDVVGTAFYLENYKSIIVPSWSCFTIYLHDTKFYQIIEDIVTSEGLFLRHRVTK